MDSDYSGLPLLKAITSASEDEINWLTRVWVYDSPSKVDKNIFPFLFINGGAATLSGSPSGAAVVKDTVTQQIIQQLQHTGTRYLYFLQFFLTLVLAIPGRRISAMVRLVLLLSGDTNILTNLPTMKAYHVSNERYTIATADCGVNATVKVWTLKRSSPHPQGRVSDSFGRR